MSVYVFSPTTGYMWAQNYYCNFNGNPPHTVVNPYDGGSWCCPIDVSGSENDNVWLQFDGGGNDAGCLSITTTQWSGVCASDPAPWNDAVIVRFYSGANATGTLLGEVMFAHLKNRIANQTFNTHNAATAMVIGNLAGDCNCGCAHGVHTHMQGSNTYSPSFSCNQSLTAGQWVYRVG